MSKPVNPMTVGGFLVGGLVLLIAGLLVFGGGQAFKDKGEYVIFFDSSLNGLNVGAPVKLQGVQIGRVTEIALRFDSESTQLLKPVVIEIDPAAIHDPRGRPLTPGATEEGRRKNAQKLIDGGFRARLEMQSLLTGLLYVEINLYPERPPRLTHIDYRNLPELPSVPTTTDVVANTLDEVIDKIRKLPLEEMVTDLSITLREIRDIVRSDETRRSQTALARTLEESQRLMVDLNRNLQPILAETRAAVSDSRATLKDTRALVNDLNGQLRPVLAATEQALHTATAVLDEGRGTVNAVGALAGPDSSLQQALVELRDAARSLHDLADFLERHPDALIYGKP
jgi:paraquat-inducible protein B